MTPLLPDPVGCPRWSWPRVQVLDEGGWITVAIVKSVSLAREMEPVITKACGLRTRIASREHIARLESEVADGDV